MKKFYWIWLVILGFQYAIAQPCSSIQSMTLGTVYTLSGLPTTGNDWTNYTNCAWNEPGDEFVFSFTAPADGYYNFTMNQTSGNPDFFLMTSCSNTSTNLLGGCWDYGTTTLFLSAGTTVYLIVDNAGTSAASCQVSVNSVTPPTNDECVNAITLSVGATCSYTSYDNNYATASAVPAPTCGNYRGGDVWFKFTVPATGRVVVDMNTGTLTDMAMAAYRGSCGSLNLIACDDDNSSNGLMPALDLNGLTPGETIYIRVWDYGSNQYGTFSICAYAPGASLCDVPVNISSCGTPITTTLTGSGDWNTAPCGTGTPGKEQIYAFTPTVTAAYYINVSSTNGKTINYAFREGSCSQFGWTCIARTSIPGSYGPFMLQAGTTYYFLLDADNASGVQHTWSIRCPETPGNYFHPTQGLQNTYVGACMVNTCSGTYKDDGNTANYSPNINQIYRTFCSNQNNKCLQATITEFILEGGSGCPYDWLIIRDGPTQNSPAIWGACGDWTSSLPLVFTASNSSGCLTFQFRSDATYQYPGWTILLSCVDCSSNPYMNNDCSKATPICGEASTAGNSVGPGTESVCSGCNLSENYSSWYRFEITSSGRLFLDVKPINLLDDYDFALYKADNCSFLGEPVRCSYAMAPMYCYSSGWWSNNCSSATGRSITNVQFNTLSNSSSCESYLRKTSSVQTTVNVGTTYPLSVTVAGGNKCYIKA